MAKPFTNNHLMLDKAKNREEQKWEGSVNCKPK